MYDYLDPGENCENIKFYHKNLTKTEETVPEDKFSTPTFGDPLSKPDLKPKLKAREQLFLFLTWFRLGYTQRHVSWLFDIPLSTYSFKIHYHVV